MREKLRQFMIGRYGTDGLNQFLSIASLVLLLIAIISRVNLFTYLGAALLIFCGAAVYQVTMFFVTWNRRSKRNQTPKDQPPKL